MDHTHTHTAVVVVITFIAISLHKKIQLNKYKHLIQSNLQGERHSHNNLCKMDPTKIYFLNQKVLKSLF